MPFDSVKARVSKKYLDLAEILPRFNGGPIKILQNVREEQRKEAEEQFRESRPPKGVSLRLDRLLMIELFPIEMHGSLAAQLRRLFPGEKQLEERIEFLADSAEKLHGGGLVQRWTHNEREPESLLLSTSVIDDPQSSRGSEAHRSLHL